MEVKAGATGTLKSLHGYMASTGSSIAVRVCSAPPRIERVEMRLTTGAPVSYDLVSIPLYLVERLNALVTSAPTR